MRLTRTLDLLLWHQHRLPFLQRLHITHVLILVGTHVRDRRPLHETPDYVAPLCLAAVDVPEPLPAALHLLLPWTASTAVHRAMHEKRLSVITFDDAELEATPPAIPRTFAVWP